MRFQSKNGILYQLTNLHARLKLIQSQVKKMKAY